MEIWFSENHSPHVRFDIRVERQLYSAESEYQRIDVFASPEFGKFLTLDGSVIFSEQDCFIYNEMVVHVPMSVHPHVEKVLIIGGGDGGVAKELINYDTVKCIDIVEQDAVGPQRGQPVQRRQRAWRMRECTSTTPMRCVFYAPRRMCMTLL